MKLDGVNALVTGANQGLGKCYTEELLCRGAAKVYACGLTLECLAPLRDTHVEGIVPLKLDVTRSDDIAAAVTAAPDLTLLFNNAGVLEAKGLIEAGSLEPFRHEMNVNVFGLAEMSMAFAPVLGRNGGGAIVNMLSVASLVNFAPFGTYCASKAAAMSITQSLRYELKEQGTKVFGIYAGMIDTDMLKDVSAAKSDPRDIARAVMEAIENDVLDINADERAVSVRQLLRDDPEHLEKTQTEFADEFRANNR